MTHGLQACMPQIGVEDVKLRSRLMSLVLFMLLLLAAGYYVTGSLDFFLGAFWSNAALIALLLGALVDQPFFSKDANVLLNTSAAAISLLGVPKEERGTLWLVLVALCIVLMALAYGLMWALSFANGRPTQRLTALARITRHVGSPRVLFSTLFLWSVIRKFGVDTFESNILFLYWSVFLTYDLLGLSRLLDNLLYPSPEANDNQKWGVVESISEPNLLRVRLEPNSPLRVGDRVGVGIDPDEALVSGTLVEDRTLVGKRIGIILMDYHQGERVQAALATANSPLGIFKTESWKPSSIQGVVEPGSTISTLRTAVRPDAQLRTGQLLQVEAPDGRWIYYQVTQATVQNVKVEGTDDSFQVVAVQAPQLGCWNRTKSCFEPYPWVPPAGRAVHAVAEYSGEDSDPLPNGVFSIGHVPSTKFRVGININDLVTHNTAILGVTGSGKSYLSFRLIEAMAAQGVKVLVLDPSRQYMPFLQKLNPTKITNLETLPSWIQGESTLGIYEFDTNNSWTPPRITSSIVEKAYEYVSSSVTLEVSVDVPARLCLVLEEAHSLIPEWNQVVDRDDSNYVNRTARVVLQGRKYGLGVMVITQRTANVTKTILNQCNTVFALRMFDQTGLDFLANYVGDQFAHTIASLPPRHCVLVGKASLSPQPIVLELDTITKDYWLVSASPAQQVAVAEH